MREMHLEALNILLRLRSWYPWRRHRVRSRVHHKATGIAGMMPISIGSTTYMLLGRHLAEIDPAPVPHTAGVSFRDRFPGRRRDLQERV
jgi:putative Mg2+ transporter-C (MgtC) family protein